jgi:type VII secretion integral membrane protein EccD
VTAWSRLTVIGTGRRADLVLPADEPVGGLVPDVLALVGDDEPVWRPHALVTSTGVTLDTEHSLADSGIRDGSVLRVVAQEQAPPPPIVVDVTETVSNALDTGTRFGAAWPRWTATGVVVVLSAASALLVVNNAAGPQGVLAVAAAAAVALAVGIGSAPLSQPLGTAAGLAGGAAGGVAALRAPAVYDLPPPVGWGAVVGVVALTLLALALSSGLGRAGLVGGTAPLALLVAWGVGAVLDLAPDRLAALMAVLSVVLLGLLPRLALVASGLFRLDDMASAGRPVPREQVDVALAAARRGLLVATVAVAACAVFAAALLLTRPTLWTVGLAAAVATVLATRSATYPHAFEVTVLLTAAVVVLLLGADAGAAATPGFPVLALLAMLATAGLTAAALAVRVPEHIRVRLRWGVDRVEALAVVAVVPLALGVFDVFDRLLGAF